MKLKTTVFKNNIEVQHAFFDTQEAQDAWTKMLEETSAWGKWERWIVDSPTSPISEEDKKKATKVEDIEISPKVPEQTLPEYTDDIGVTFPEQKIPEQLAIVDKCYFLPAEYELIIEDVTKQYEAEQLAQQKEDQISKAVQVLDAGKRIIAYVGMLNRGLDITEDETIVFTNFFLGLKNLLEVGSLVTARTQIGLIPVGVMGITEEYKEAVLEKITQYINQYGLS
jgi:hypothetical protein